MSLVKICCAADALRGDRGQSRDVVSLKRQSPLDICRITRNLPELDANAWLLGTRHQYPAGVGVVAWVSGML
jgi:hypothetical protein